MALNQQQLKSSIKSLMEDMMKREQTSIDEFADSLASAIVSCIKTGQVTVAAGIVVQVTPSTGTGATTSTGIGTIN
jgi:TRAP-type uncharacterized transport system fused permease subunit